MKRVYEPFIVLAIVIVGVFVYTQYAGPLFSPSDLILHYPFDSIESGNRVRDLSSNHYDGNSISAQIGDGVLSSGLLFNGSSVVSTNSDIDLGSSFTISAWVKPEDVGQEELPRLITKERWGVSRPSYTLYLDYQERVHFAFSGPTEGDYVEVMSAYPLSIGRWNFVTVTFRGGELSIQVRTPYEDNGVISEAFLTNISFVPNNNEAPVTIGAGLYNTINFAFFKGIIDDVRIYSRALDREHELDSIYDEGISKFTRLRYDFESISQNNVLDNSSYGFNGRVVNGEIVPGIVGQGALRLRGNGYVEVTDNDAIDMHGGTFLISAWIKTSAGGNQIIMEKNDANGGNSQFKSLGLYVGSDGKFHFFGRCNLTGEGFDTSSQTTVKDGRWHLVTARRDARENILEIYVDGVREVAVADNLQCDDFGTAEPLYIGARMEPGLQLGFDGAIDDFTISTREISHNERLEDDLTAIYDSAMNRRLYLTFDDVRNNILPDESLYGAVGSVRGGATTGDGRRGRAMIFDGVDDFVEFQDGSAFTLREMSWLAWIKNTGNGTQLVAEQLSPVGGATRGIYIDASGSLHFFGLWEAATGGQDHNSGVMVRDNAWHHIAIVRGNGERIFYVDGVARANFSDVQTGTADPVNLFYVGSRGGTQYFFNGMIDEMAIYDRVLSPSEISSAYSTMTLPPTPAPIPQPQPNNNTTNSSSSSGGRRCSAEWECIWSSCASGQQRYSCVAANSCARNNNRPLEYDRSCSSSNTLGFTGGGSQSVTTTQQQNSYNPPKASSSGNEYTFEETEESDRGDVMTWIYLILGVVIAITVILIVFFVVKKKRTNSEQKSQSPRFTGQPRYYPAR